MDSGLELSPKEGLPVLVPSLYHLLSADDHSRVRLVQLAGEPHSDYINANFIPVRAPAGPGTFLLGFLRTLSCANCASA